MEKDSKRVLSGIQPTGELHLGNYFGAVDNWVKLQDTYECVFCVVDLHTMTMPYDPQKLRSNTKDMFVSLLACGIDPEKSILFIQSTVPEHTELSWVLNCVTSYGELTRMTQFKDKSALVKEREKEQLISAGLLNYPILQAADILLYKAELVPVGKDQEQHLELSRNIATRFNNQFGAFFPMPEPLFTQVPKLMSLASPERKMSKSLGPKHYIGIFDDENIIRKKVRGAVTDTGEQQGDDMSAGVRNLFEILKACKRNDVADQLTSDFHGGRLQYKTLKDEAGQAVVDLVQPIQKRKEELLADQKYIKELMQQGAERAAYHARKTMQKVRRKTGLTELKK